MLGCEKGIVFATQSAVSERSEFARPRDSVASLSYRPFWGDRRYNRGNSSDQPLSEIIWRTRSRCSSRTVLYELIAQMGH